MQTWADCISYRRFGQDNNTDNNIRSEFIRDYDRIIFSSSFRRLQNKTQVFPLPGNVFVHNRLTHSLEVASVGRSLGSIIGNALGSDLVCCPEDNVQNFYKYDLSGVIASACLAHDVGNPAFGHSGEKAISSYFLNNADKLIAEIPLKSFFTEAEWQDISDFEGNANALRLLTHQFKGKLKGGHHLTFVTLASLLKYPCDSMSVDKTFVHRKKYGYFCSERPVFSDIVEIFKLKQPDNKYKRHPFVYLVEAADDICYRIVDMEDAHRIKILSTHEIEAAFLSIIETLETNSISILKIKDTLAQLGDLNEKVAYLRAKCINILVNRAAEIFIKNKDYILSGTFNNSLMDLVEKDCRALKEVEKISIEKIYNHPSVIEVEIAGYNVLSEILDLFVAAALNPHRTSLQKKSLNLIPKQYAYYDDMVSPYEKVMGILDFVTGMTDGYATELYRKMKGIDISIHK